MREHRIRNTAGASEIAVIIIIEGIEYLCSFSVGRRKIRANK